MFWLKKIKEFKKDNSDDQDHNKLWVYKTFKSSFTAEPYLTFVRNRNQRSYLTRLRISAHCLATETLRRTRPVTPYNQRFCVFCQTQPGDLNTNQICNESNSIPIQFLDTEQHFLLGCNRFINTRNIFLDKISTLKPGFMELTESEKFSTLMCPTSAQLTKTVNRFIRFMVEIREKISSGEFLTDLTDLTDL